MRMLVLQWMSLNGKKQQKINIYSATGLNSRIVEPVEPVLRKIITKHSEMDNKNILLLKLVALAITIY